MYMRPCHLLDLSIDAVCEEVLRLQLASYAIEAKLIDYDRIPALFDTPESLRQSGDVFLGQGDSSVEGGSLVGVLSFRRQGRAVEVNRVVVHPDRFRQGIATALLGTLDELCHGVRGIHVETATSNTPAVRLYLKLGYEEVSRREVHGGLLVSRFRKNLA